jgi:hypothetical protein
MFQAIRDFFTLPARFKKLQADHDLRAALNNRLQRHNNLQKNEIARLLGFKSAGHARHVERQIEIQQQQKAHQHIQYMRVEVERRMLANLLPLSVVIEIQEAVAAMTYDQVVAHKNPKREVKSCSQK